LLVQAEPVRSSDTRGIRNNNPGNIVHTPSLWTGEVECKDVRFKCFSTLRGGLEAMIYNIDAYYLKYKLKSIEGIVSRWSPSNENDTERLIADVTTNFDSLSDSKFSINNSIHYTILIRSLIKQENGDVPYTDKYIWEVVNDTSRIIDDGSKYSVRWSNESVVAVNRIKEADSYSTVEYAKRQEEGNTRSKEGQKSTVYTSTNSSIFSSCYNYTTKVSRDMGRTCNLWMDRVAERLPILHRGREYSSLEGSQGGRNTPHPTGYTSRKCYYRPLLWWLPCW